MDNILSLDQVREVAPSVFSSSRAPGLSDRYRPVCTAEVVKPVLGDGWQIVQAGQSQSRDPANRFFKRHLLRLSHPDLASLGGSEFRIDALITNSGDGSRAVKVAVGVWRFICANGIVDGEDLDSVSIRHIHPQEKVQEAFAQVVARAPKISGRIENWQAFQLSDDQVHAFTKHAARIRFGDRQVDLGVLNDYRRAEDYGNDLWHTFNRLQENSLRAGVPYTFKTGRAVKSRTIRSIDTNLKVNRALWNAAETLYSGGDLALPS